MSGGPIKGGGDRIQETPLQSVPSSHPTTVLRLQLLAQRHTRRPAVHRDSALKAGLTASGRLGIRVRTPGSTENFLPFQRCHTTWCQTPLCSERSLGRPSRPLPDPLLPPLHLSRRWPRSGRECVLHCPRPLLSGPLVPYAPGQVLGHRQVHPGYQPGL